MGVVLLLRLIDLMFTLYTFAFIARALLPLFRIDPYHPVMRFLYQITEPLLMPLRRYITPVGGLDFTPMAAILILWAAQWLLQTLIMVFFG